MSARIGLTVTDEMDAKLEELAGEMNSIKSEIIRAALRDFLEKHGKTLNDKIQRGGERQKKDGK